MLWVIAAAALFLAFSNGANDNFKGFATVWGAHALSYRKALTLATLATVAGSAASLLLAGELLRAFSGAGLVPSDVAEAPAFMAAVAIGAAITVMGATRAGYPISTTHALLGGLIGAGLAAAGGELNLSVLGSKFVLPLLLSPVLAAGLSLGAYSVLRRRDADCLCLMDVPDLANQGGVGSAVQAFSTMPSVMIASAQACDAGAAPAARFDLASLRDRVHIFSAATICFARSVNDTPKLAALLLGAQLAGVTSMTMVAAAMAGGGLILSRRVAETMSLRLNRMDARQALSANVITAGLVLLASKFGLPVSTTHVTVSSIAGAGWATGTTNGNVLRSVLLSWLATLPVAAVSAWVTALVLIRV